MQLSIIKVDQTSLNDWESLNRSVDESSFLSSIPWISFQKTNGKEIDMYLIYFQGQLIGNIYIEISRRKVSKFAYTPYGPVIDLKKLNELLEFTLAEDEVITKIYGQLKNHFKNYIKEKKANLFKIDPLLDFSYRDALKKAGYTRSLSLGQAKDTWIMDIEDDAPKILQSLKKDTRYYINRAGKKGVEVVKAETIEDVKAFYRLVQETTIRNDFTNYPESYFVNQWTQLRPLGMTEIYLAKYEDKYISGALINYYKENVYYAHGASTSDKELSNLASPYFLHWQIILDAKAKGYRKYNFWGVIPKGVDHPWRGLSDFKMKFDGVLIRYTGPYEVYTNPIKYFYNRLADWWAYRKERYN